MLKGRLVVLRPPKPGDVSWLLALRNDVPLQLSLMALPRANTPRRVEDWLARRVEDPSGLFFIVARASRGAGLGWVQLTDMNTVHGTANLGICLAAPARGKGYAAEALRLLEEHARGVFRVRKLVLHVAQTNARAVAFYRKHHWREVGLHREHVWQKGRYLDVLVMEKLLGRGGSGRSAS